MFMDDAAFGVIWSVESVSGNDQGLGDPAVVVGNDVLEPRPVVAFVFGERSVESVGQVGHAVPGLFVVGDFA